jgi:hypothetical protein
MIARGKDADGAPSGRMTIFLSAFVYPGLGQFAQRRWASGILHAGAFTACLLWFAVCAVRTIGAFYRLGFEFGSYQPGDVPLRAMAVSFVLGVVAYVWNLGDAYAGVRRQSRRKAPPPGIAP